MDDDFQEFQKDEEPQRFPCPVCQRKFNEDILSRHVSICEKSTKKRRKPFNSQKQRCVDGDVKVNKQSKNDDQIKTPKKNNWKEKHEIFLASIRAARGVSNTENTSSEPVNKRKILNPDYIQCPHCERRFNEHSATRHIEFCKEQKSRIATTKKPGTDNLTKLAKRTQYKPPLPGKKCSSANTPQRRMISPKSCAEKDKDRIPSVKPVRRTQSSKVTDTKQELITKRRSSSLVGKNTSDGHANLPNSNVTNGENHLFHDDEISRAASGNRRNRGRQNTRDLYDIDLKNEEGFATMESHREIKSGRRKDSRHNSPSNISRSESGISVGSTRQTTKLSKFCYECGTKYPVEHAKYCCECGMKRLNIN